jgi:hypothetical protein
VEVQPDISVSGIILKISPNEDVAALWVADILIPSAECTNAQVDTASGFRELTAGNADADYFVYTAGEGS